MLLDISRSKTNVKPLLNDDLCVSKNLKTPENRQFLMIFSRNMRFSHPPYETRSLCSVLHPSVIRLISNKSMERGVKLDNVSLLRRDSNKEHQSVA